MTTDTDSRLLEIFRTTYLSSEGLATAVQQYLDAATAEVVSELEAEDARKQVTIKRLTEELASVKKERDLGVQAQIKQASFKWQTDSHLLSVARSKNPIIRFLSKVAGWPSPDNEYAVTKYNTLTAVLAELNRQDTKWGEARQQPNGTGPRFNFDSGLADHYRKITDDNFAAGRGTWADILTEEFYEAMAEENPRKLKLELIQVAAVAVAWVVSLTLQRKKKK
jgi:hypothetical protein